MTRWGLRAVVGVSAALIAGGCAGPGTLEQRPAGQVAHGWRAPGPFPPVALRVFPLTRLERDEQGRARLILHVELKDEWGDTVKGAGELTVQLRRPPGMASGGGRDEVRWDVSLWGSEDNARYYDPSSRTYRVVLGDLPAWVEALVPTSPGEGSRGEASVKVTAQFKTPKADGTMRSLWGETELRL